ncbi:MAG: penicillin-binding protein [Bacteroidetes bacterium]|jgi:beta-lactam-binding protein with PASTA domain|nr:penicillin-binding protein [Bacteroidota bacterium]
MRDFFRFLRTKTFFIHFTLAVLSALLVLWIAFKCMGIYTNHGDVVQVPDFTGQPITELDAFVNGKNVTYRIIDSLYNPKEKPGTVISQDPEKNSEVKHNRTIYLYVTSVLPPQIAMPKLIDRSLRQATAMIESYGLKTGKTKFVADPCNNCVLKQLFDGKEITPGTLIKKGSVISLVVGKGASSDAQTSVINVTGLTYCQAKSKLVANGLSIGALILDAPMKDTCSAFIYKQSPGADNIVNMGASVDLFITNDKKKLTNEDDEIDGGDDDDGK